MTPNSILAFATAIFCGVLALAALFRTRHSVASWCFILGMAAFALESGSIGVSMQSPEPENIVYWQTISFLIRSFLPGLWLCFSLSYSRGNYRAFLVRWRFALGAAFLLPLGLAFGCRADLVRVLPLPETGQAWWLTFSGPAKILDSLFLIANVFILMNLEKTFRSSIGTMRWRIKFVVLGLAVIFATRVYTLSQALLFSSHDLSLAGIDTAALFMGCTLMVVAYVRNGFAEIDVYPSQAVIQTSVTVLVAGSYLFAVGVLAQVIAFLGGSDNFQTQALVILLGIVALAVMLLSNRFRQKIQQFASRHFERPQHDFRKVWTSSTRHMSSARDSSSLCAASAKLISETFNILSVTILLLDERKEQFAFAASTSQSQGAAGDPLPGLAVSGSVAAGLVGLHQPMDLDTAKEQWAASLKQAIPAQFQKGGHSIALPLAAGERLVGVAILADRVNGVPYTMEELDLLKCIGDQIAAGLLNFRLTEDLMVAKEMEAFQTMSAFFVHDLKNTVSSLNLMLKNLPVHFDDPAFREDALRGIASTVHRINHLIARLSVLRHKLELKPVETDLVQLVTEALDKMNGTPDVELLRQLEPLPKIVVDRDQIQSVVTNLLFNAREAVGRGGQIRVETSQGESRAIFAVSDNGCGMSPAFLSRSLFRPFHSTKKNGLGIGMFQSKMIVEAHGGTIHVDSEPGRGTTFRVSLPLRSRPQ